MGNGEPLNLLDSGFSPAAGRKRPVRSLKKHFGIGEKFQIANNKLQINHNDQNSK
jgi:hypothetical protein